MIKLLLILFFLITIVDAKETCYSVQLLSRIDNGENTINTQGYPDDCKAMKIGKSLTLRCGCFSYFKKAKKRRDELIRKHKKAMVVTTYKYRFAPQHSSDKNNYVEKAILQTEIQVKDTNSTKEQKKTKNKNNKDKKVCYSVQILSTAKTQTNLNALLQNTYPQGCKVMAFKRSFAVRCGCYTDFSKVKQRYSTLRKKYKNAHLSDTYAYRFKKDYKVSRNYVQRRSISFSPFLSEMCRIL